MIKTEFGIIEDIRETQEYSYDPKKYQCVCIDDDVYIDEWWNKLVVVADSCHRATLGNDVSEVIQ